MRHRIVGIAGAFILLVTLSLGALAYYADSRTPQGEWIEAEAVWSDRFVESIGVNTHLSWYPNTSYARLWPQLKEALVELGVRHVRSHSYDSGDVIARDRVRDLARNHGILTLLTPAGLPDVIDLGVECLSGVEGINEPDGHWRGLPEPATSHLKRLYEGITSTPATRHLPVLHCALADPVNSPSRYGDAMKNCTVGNIHPYAGSGAPSGPSGSSPGQSVDESITLIRKHIVGDKPIWATECGYHNGLRHRDGHEEASESAVAKLLPRMLFVYAIKGIERSYIYQLADETSDQLMTFGILRHDATPKPAYHSLRNLIGILSDRGAEPESATLRFRFGGSMEGVWYHLLQKRDGRLYLALWQEVDSYDSRTRRDVKVPAKRVAVEFDRVFSQIKLYEPLTSESPLRKLPREKVVALDVPDHPVLLELTP